jgi:hypothetical protein
MCLEVRSVKDVRIRKAMVSCMEVVLTGKLGRLSHFDGLRALAKKTGVVLTMQKMGYAGDNGGIVCGSGAAAAVMRACWRLVIGIDRFGPGRWLVSLGNRQIVKSTADADWQQKAGSWSAQRGVVE